MIDPTLSLALAFHSNRGGYALLLGSGLSRTAGVPTGWEIVQDLIRRLAHLLNQSTDAPEDWYQQQFGRAPEYSDLLGQLATSPAERMQLLRGYFEPTAKERDEGSKLPTAAHRAIAKLVSAGYVRVIVTTNFDRLLEGALQEVGIQPTVIGTTDAALGALPLVHSTCTLIKLNGDYLDSRLKNTGDELSHYDSELERLLDQVFDQYGLVLCGWSAEWDTALRGALERCTTHRFTTYWAVRDKLGQKARDLVALRRATVVPIVGADEFFTEVLEKLLALETFAESDVLSTKVAVARMKKYLSDSAQRINLHDLLTAETERAYAAVIGSRFPMGVSVNPSEVAARLQAYETALATVLSLMICGSQWAEPEHDALLLRCYKRLADLTGPQSGFTVLLSLRRYPALLLLYAMGITAVSRGNYRFLRGLLLLRIRENEYKAEESVAVAVHDQSVMEREVQGQTLSGKHTPLSNWLFKALREPLREYLPDDVEYDRMFDWFEYLLCLCHCDAKHTRQDIADARGKDPAFILWASVGRFGWKESHEGAPGIQVETRLREGEPFPEKVASVINAGFFESDGHKVDKYAEVKAAFDRCATKVRETWLWPYS